MRSYLFSVLAIQSIAALRVGAASFERQGPGPLTTLTRSQIDAFLPSSHFAAAAYCPPGIIQPWSCGANCEANSDFIPHATGGDGGSEQYWFVGYSPAQQSVIVSHQGTDPSRIESLLTNVDIFFTSLDPRIFPRIPTGVKVHGGFAGDHFRSAKDILSAVRETLLEHNATRVTTIGHSLGGALALLDGIFLPLHIKEVSFNTITYAMPRVGNKAFADYVDTHVSLTHINNKNDPIPVLPPRLLGYQQASGEIHITKRDTWISCPGQDNTNPLCSAGGIRADLEDHYGPYNGVIMKAGCNDN